MVAIIKCLPALEFFYRGAYISTVYGTHLKNFVVYNNHEE